jgi:CheY-like chemotaxis protein/HPt (histidine-containing phosphotransfer) domain-containing protein
MTGVLGMVDLLGAEPLTDHQRSYLDAMRASGRHLLSLINDILDFTRIESGRLELDEAEFELPELLEGVRAVMHPLAMPRGIGLEMAPDPDVPVALTGDPLRLKQVLMNLVGNAIKFTSVGSVRVRVTRLPAPEPDAVWLRFEVHDSGVGVEPEQLRRLFAPFMQADRSISRKYGGSGLGLAISKRLVELMGGRIGAESVPGQGSVFHFEVPLRAGEALADTVEGASHRAEVAPRRILVAEDIEINRRILQGGLGRQGHQLTFAVNGAEALAKLEEGDFDLVLMDVQMPVMDGVEATRRIRCLAGPKAGIPVLGLTANVIAREREQYVSAGMTDCLMKPFDWDQLAAAIARYGGDAPAAGPLVAPSRPVAVSGPLDEAALAALGEMGEPKEVESLVRAALESYGSACSRMLEPTAAAEEVRRSAHDICGTAGMLGLHAIWEQAARIEGAPEAPDLVQRVGALRHAMASTTELLLARGVITRPDGAEETAAAALSGSDRCAPPDRLSS